MHLRLLMFLTLLLVWVSPALSAESDPPTVRFLAQDSDDQRFYYPGELLQLALQKSGTEFDLVPNTSRIQQQRAMLEVTRGDQLNIMWTMTSDERENLLRPIRIPIYRGLIGLRIPLVRADNEDLLADITTVDELRALRAGQGYGWPDTTILQANELPVVAGSDYRQLFPMLNAGRFDYFPRSILEIWAEADTHAADNIIVSPHLALRYPAAVYFFVAPDDDVLAEALETGLNRAIADGSFQALFESWYGDAIARADLDSRVILELNNPLLPEATPLDREELWFRP